MALDNVQTVTAGQVAYETYFLDMENTAPAGALRWQALEPRERDAWEAAARAVLADGLSRTRAFTSPCRGPLGTQKEAPHGT